jgi:single-stranded-DNA-specific exonuclease
MMPMSGENRVLVHYGLKVLAKNRRVGLAALCATAGISPEQASSATLGFALGPRFNASGRMGDNIPMLELLLAKDTRVAERLARDVEEANKQRQRLVGRIQEEAEELLFTQNSSDDRCFVVVGDGWPGGVVGLVAGRLAGRWSRPVIVGTKLVDGLVRASARSIPEYSIIDALTRCGGQLTSFGGHHGAAGLSLKAETLPGFLDQLKRDAAEQLSPEQLIPLHVADLHITPAELELETALSFQRLAPFGIGNVPPLCLLTDVVLGEPKSLGANGTHYKWQARVGGQSLEVIGFGAAAEFKARPLATAHLLGHLEPNHWNNQTRLQFRLVDYRPTDHPIEQLA